MNDSYTIGNWPTEIESAAALDSVLDRVDLWKVYPEVTGTLSQPRPAQAQRTIRIDRVLVPNAKLLQLGWRHGVVGIEIKRSNIKIGPPIAQAMDYSRAVWTLPNGGIKVWLDWVFVWPMQRQIGTVASILAQNRIGTACSDKWSLLHLKSGEQNVVKVYSTGEVDLGSALNGQKAGSR